MHEEAVFGQNNLFSELIYIINRNGTVQTNWTNNDVKIQLGLSVMPYFHFILFMEHFYPYFSSFGFYETFDVHCREDR